MSGLRWRDERPELFVKRVYKQPALDTLDESDDGVQSTHFDIMFGIMANLSVRGLDDKAMAALKRRAAKEVASVNTLVLRFIEQGLGLQRAKPALTRHDDLDGLAGTWRKQDASEFERSTAHFAKVDASLWK